MKDRKNSLSLLYLLTLVRGFGGNAFWAKDTVVRAKKVYTVTKGIIEDGEIHIRDGRIHSVGETVDAPTDAEVFDAVEAMP